ncbi:MAG: hypothetical protein WA919_26550 [Coleofasciculaceae cyanobacterium]
MLKHFKKVLSIDRHIFCLNALAIIILLFLSISVKTLNRGDVLVSLFDDPFSASRPYIGTLATLTELMWCTSLTICLWSLGILKKIQPNRKVNLFIFYSTIGTGILFIDDVFRINLILEKFGIPKLIVYLVYGTAALAYGLYFRRIIGSTPYILLIISASLFIISGLGDSLLLAGRGAKAMLEDGTRLLGILNLTLYFQQVCWQEVLQSLSRKR